MCTINTHNLRIQEDLEKDAMTHWRYVYTGNVHDDKMAAVKLSEGTALLKFLLLRLQLFRNHSPSFHYTVNGVNKALLKSFERLRN